MLVSTLLIITDLPEPVCPAISRWGILARSPITGDPAISLPIIKLRCPCFLTQASDFKIPLISTVEALILGTSTPTSLFPGMGASILIE